MIRMNCRWLQFLAKLTTCFMAILRLMASMKTSNSSITLSTPSACSDKKTRIDGKVEVPTKARTDNGSTDDNTHERLYSANPITLQYIYILTTRRILPSPCPRQMLILTKKQVSTIRWNYRRKHAIFDRHDESISSENTDPQLSPLRNPGYPTRFLEFHVEIMLTSSAKSSRRDIKASLNNRPSDFIDKPTPPLLL